MVLSHLNKYIARILHFVVSGARWISDSDMFDRDTGAPLGDTSMAPATDKAPIVHISVIINRL